MTDTTRLKSTIFIGGLHPTVTTTTLHSAFTPFGEISDISLPRPENPNSHDPHRGFGYIEFAIPSDAADAIDNMDQAELYGRVIKVAAAKPSQTKREGGDGVLGARTAVWEQEGWLSAQGVDGKEGVRDEDVVMDPTSGLEGLDVAGPRGE